ncbi:MAG: dTDP-4-dehydrorhamnose reductase [Comamonadaceae bacterium]|nr:MAG: dTDP-4-dehydrorhamnose reductase [Comamonadaceae bacterium]
MKILLLGATGQVGNALRRSLSTIGEVVATTRDGTLDGVACETADIGDSDSLPALVERIAPDVVVNAAAYTAVDRAEQEPEVAFAANAEGPGRLAAACALRGARLVHYSTDYVFDGVSSRAYAEDDATAPLGVYGASKLAGEQAVRNSKADHLIFRTAWVYGTHGHNFLRTMLRLGAEREELRVVADQIGSPTPSYLIADITAAAIARELTAGTYHLVTSGRTSWHAFAEAIMRQAVALGLLAKAPLVTAIATSDYPTPARRPSFSLLDNSRLSNALGLTFPDWETGLERVLQDLSKVDSG